MSSVLEQAVINRGGWLGEGRGILTVAANQERVEEKREPCNKFKRVG